MNGEQHREAATGRSGRTRAVGAGRLLGYDILPLVVPLLAILAGLGIVATDAWRPGLLVIGAAIALAALGRLVLPPRLAGLLAVRGRAFDVIVLTVLAGGVIAVTIWR